MDVAARVDRGRRVRGWDIAIALWIVGCILLAVWIAVSVRRLEPVGDTLVVSSRALEETSAALDTIKDVPFVGDEVTRVSQRIDETARSARESGLEARAAIDSVSITLAVAVLAVAVVPPLAGYLFARRRWAVDAGERGTA